MGTATRPLRRDGARRLSVVRSVGLTLLLFLGGCAASASAPVAHAKPRFAYTKATKAPSACPPSSHDLHDCWTSSGLYEPNNDGQIHVTPGGAGAGEGNTSCMSFRLRPGDALPALICQTIFQAGHPFAIYANRGQLQFDDVTVASGFPVADDIDPSQPMIGVGVGVDLDADGCDDIIVSPFRQAFFDLVTHLFRGEKPADAPTRQGIRVFKNDCSGHFKEVTAALGFDAFEGGGLALAAAMADLNRDGKPDLLLQRISLTGARLPELVKLYVSQPDGRWKDVLDAAIEPVFGQPWSIAFSDWNEDGNPDLLILNNAPTGSDPSRLFLHDADPHVVHYQEMVIPEVFGSGKIDAMGAAKISVRADMAMRYFITDIGAQHLFEREGAGVKDISAQSGLAALDTNLSGDLEHQSGDLVAFVPAFVDLYHDGRISVLAVASVDGAHTAAPYTQLFTPSDDGTFVSAGAAILGSLQAHSGQQLLIDDLDGDCLPDFLLSGTNGPPQLLRNHLPTGHTLSLGLKGKAGQTTMGARVHVVANGHSVTRELGMLDSVGLFFGLGPQTEAELVEVFWVDGTVTHREHVAMGCNVLITQGQ